MILDNCLTQGRDWALPPWGILRKISPQIFSNIFVSLLFIHNNETLLLPPFFWNEFQLTRKTCWIHLKILFSIRQHALSIIVFSPQRECEMYTHTRIRNLRPLQYDNFTFGYLWQFDCYGCCMYILFTLRVLACLVY